MSQNEAGAAASRQADRLAKGQDAQGGTVEAPQAQEGCEVDSGHPASSEEHRGIALTEYLWLADGRSEQIEPLFDDLSAVCRKHGVAWLGGVTHTNTELRDGFPWEHPPTPAADPATPSAPDAGTWKAAWRELPATCPACQQVLSFEVVARFWRGSDVLRCECGQRLRPSPIAPSEPQEPAR